MTKFILTAIDFNCIFNYFDSKCLTDKFVVSLNSHLTARFRMDTNLAERDKGRLLKYVQYLSKGRLLKYVQYRCLSFRLTCVLPLINSTVL